MDDTAVDAAQYYHTLATEQRMVLRTGSGRRFSVCMCIWRILCPSCKYPSSGTTDLLIYQPHIYRGIHCRWRKFTRVNFSSSRTTNTSEPRHERCVSSPTTGSDAQDRASSDAPQPHLANASYQLGSMHCCVDRCWPPSVPKPRAPACGKRPKLCVTKSPWFYTNPCLRLTFKYHYLPSS